MALNGQRFKDHCLIIVGDGGDADRILAERRLAAGGRLAHFRTEGPDDLRVKMEFVDDGSSCDYFTWQPPSKQMPISSFAKKLSARPRSFWTKSGPDGVALQAGQKLIIRAGVDCQPRHLLLTDHEDNVLVEMSGEIVLNIDKAMARSFDVEVYNPELKAFGSFSWGRVRWAVLLGFLLQMVKVLLSIQWEQGAVEGEVPWFRGFLSILDWSLASSFICIEMWSFSMTGLPANSTIHALSNFASTVVMMCACYFKLSEFVTYLSGVVGIYAVVLLHYYSTREACPTRRLLPHVKWTIAHVIGTTGSFVAFALIAQVYSLLLASGQGLAASIFLPFTTALVETGTVIFARIAYHGLVHSKRDQDGQGPVVGDQTYLACVTMVISAHGFAEACRVSATFAGAVSSGGYAWVSTSILSMALNISARLGWSRYLLIQLTKWTCGGPTAMRIFAPSGWSKFHDEQKIYCGYFRFVFLVALAAARAIAFRSWEGGESFFEGPNAPIFNLSATILIPTLLLLETIEDEIVTREWLPVNPVGPGLLKVNAAGDNADPAQLITLEHLPNVADDPWKMEDLQSSGVSCRRTTSCGSLTQEQLMKTPSLTIQQEKHLWARFRARLGQPRNLNPSPALHGLRDLPFMMIFSFVAIVSSITSSLVALLLGAGYMRGRCEIPLEGGNRVLGLIYWDVPLPCH